MDKQELDTKIADIAKTLLSYCAARTANQFEAEDLVQDIIVEIYKSADTIRNTDAFYGFMWAVAGNVYKQWCKAKVRNKECALTDNLFEEAVLLEDEQPELYLLRRELTLLSEKYRKAVILYYMERKSCSEISRHLSISESMVKYLLFKSRQILKEGMNMERNYGQQSYNPRGLSLLYWGKDGKNRYYHLCDSKISQNILFACYNDMLTAEQISLEIGVSLPYMEDKLKELYEYDLLKKDGNRYYTNIVIFTRDFASEANAKTAAMQERIADILSDAIAKHEDAVRSIGFAGADMRNNAFAWQMVCFILYTAVVEILQSKIKVVYPKDKFGTECFVWGAENGEQTPWEAGFGFGIAGVKNENGDRIQFMDFPINGEMVHLYGFNQQKTNVFLDVAKGRTEHFSENDKALAADMVRKGYMRSGEKGLVVNVPIFTKEQHQKIKAIFADAAMKIAEEAERLLETVTKILKEHTPVHLKKRAKDMAYLRLFEDTIAVPVAILYDRKYLLPYNHDGVLPTTYVILTCVE